MKQNTHIDQLAEKLSIDTYELVLINAWYPFYRPSRRVLPWHLVGPAQTPATLCAHYRRITLDYRPRFYSIRPPNKIKAQQ